MRGASQSIHVGVGLGVVVVDVVVGIVVVGVVVVGRDELDAVTVVDVVEITAELVAEDSVVADVDEDPIGADDVDEEPGLDLYKLILPAAPQSSSPSPSQAELQSFSSADSVAALGDVPQ